MNNEVKLKGLAGLAQLLSPGADWAYDNAARCVRDYVKEQTLELAAKDVAIEKLRDNIGGLIGENNDYMERCAEKDARLDVLQRAVEWQPIETAPKSGETILLYVDIALFDGKRGVIETGRYCSDETGEGWRGDGDQCIPTNQHVFTHWMPLPSPPAPIICPGSGKGDGNG